MATLQTMYSGMVNSPTTELSAAIDAAQTSITVLNGAALPVAPNLATIGNGETAETVRYTGKSGNMLTGVTRGFQGSARSWSIGQPVARQYTAYDHDTVRVNVETLAGEVDGHTTQLADMTQDIRGRGVNVKYPPSPLVAAVGDGITDDTTAIQNIINAVSDGSIINIPEGIYILTSLKVSKSVIFQSTGGAVLKFIDGLNSNTNMFDVLVNGISVQFLGITFDGNKDNLTVPNNVNRLQYKIINWQMPGNIVNTNQSFITVRDCKFLNTPSNAIFVTGYDVVEKSDSSEALIFYISSNYFEKGFENAPNYRDTVILSVTGNCNGIIEGNNFIKNEEIFLYGLSAITVTTNDTSVEVFSTVVIRDNYFENYGRQGATGLGPIGVVDFYASARDLIIENNRFADSYYMAIKGKTNSKNTNIDGNIIRGCVVNGNTNNKSYGIDINRGTHFGIYSKYIVEGNIISDVYGGGITLSGAGSGFTPAGNISDVVVTGNIVESIAQAGTSSYGIYLTNVDNAVITSNVLRNNVDGIRLHNFKKEFVISDNQIFNSSNSFIIFQGYTVGESGYTNYDGTVIVQANTMRTLVDPSNSVFRCVYFEAITNVILTNNYVKIEGVTAPQNFLRTGSNINGLVSAHNNIVSGVAVGNFFGMTSGTLVKSNNYNNGTVIT